MDVYEAIATRRDVRNEFSGETVADDTLHRLLAAAHAAPSVGNTRPRDFVVVQRPETLNRFAAHVTECRDDFARSLPADRASTFRPISIEGIKQARTGVVVTYDQARGGPHVLGRHTIDETGRLSVALAVENLWLAATAEGIGVGWVSFYRPAFVRELLAIPAGVEPMAWLCVGPVVGFQEVPDLERFGWRSGRPLDAAVHRETFAVRGGASLREQ